MMNSVILCFIIWINFFENLQFLTKINPSFFIYFFKYFFINDLMINTIILNFIFWIIFFENLQVLTKINPSFFI